MVGELEDSAGAGGVDGVEVSTVSVSAVFVVGCLVSFSVDKFVLDIEVDDWPPSSVVLVEVGFSEVVLTDVGVLESGVSVGEVCVEGWVVVEASSMSPGSTKEAPAANPAITININAGVPYFRMSGASVFSVKFSIFSRVGGRIINAVAIHIIPPNAAKISPWNSPSIPASSRNIPLPHTVKVFHSALLSAVGFISSPQFGQ